MHTRPDQELAAEVEKLLDDIVILEAIDPTIAQPTKADYRLEFNHHLQTSLEKFKQARNIIVQIHDDGIYAELVKKFEAQRSEALQQIRQFRGSNQPFMGGGFFDITPKAMRKLQELDVMHRPDLENIQTEVAVRKLDEMFMHDDHPQPLESQQDKSATDLDVSKGKDEDERPSPVMLPEQHPQRLSSVDHAIRLLAESISADLQAITFANHLVDSVFTDDYADLIEVLSSPRISLYALNMPLFDASSHLNDATETKLTELLQLCKLRDELIEGRTDSSSQDNRASIEAARPATQVSMLGMEAVDIRHSQNTRLPSTSGIMLGINPDAAKDKRAMLLAAKKIKFTHMTAPGINISFLGTGDVCNQSAANEQASQRYANLQALKNRLQALSNQPGSVSDRLCFHQIITRINTLTNFVNDGYIKRDKNNNYEADMVTYIEKNIRPIIRLIDQAPAHINKLIRDLIPGYPAALFNAAPAATESHRQEIIFDGCDSFARGNATFAFGIVEQARLAAATIQQALQTFMKNPDNHSSSMEINLDGFSRGAVTAMLTAKKLASLLTPEEQARISVTLNLQDPVPGNLPGFTSISKHGVRAANLVADLSHCRFINKANIYIHTAQGLKPDSLLKKAINVAFACLVPKLPQGLIPTVAVLPAWHVGSMKKSFIDTLYTNSANNPLHHLSKHPELKKERASLTAIGRFGLISKSADGTFLNAADYVICRDILNRTTSPQDWEDDIRPQVKKKLAATYFRNILDKVSEVYLDNLQGIMRSMQQPYWYPKFLFGSTRLSRDPELSSINAVTITKDNNGMPDFKPVYQRVMIHLDLVLFKLGDKKGVSKAILALQDALKELAGHAEPKLDDMVSLIQNTLNQEKANRHVRAALTYILTDKNQLFSMKEITELQHDRQTQPEATSRQKSII